MSAQQPEVRDDVRLGPRVSTAPSPKPADDLCLVGDFVTLTGLSKDDIPSLWQNLGLPNNEALLAYLPLTPPETTDDLWEALQSMKLQRGFIIYAIKGDPSRLSPSSSKPKDGSETSSYHSEVVGVIAYLDVQPLNRALEIGAVIYSPALQRTTAATEVVSLLLHHAFGDDVASTPGLSPPYRRVVWKCNKLNRGSRRAAERLGFVYEGTFRKHLIVKGRSRDSDWLSIVDEEWPAVKAGLQAWLKPANFDGSGSQICRLEQCREEAKV